MDKSIQQIDRLIRIVKEYEVLIKQQQQLIDTLLRN